MNDAEVMRHFEETGAVLNGHFELSSGLHSDRYVQCARVLMHPDRAELLCRDLAGRIPDRDDIDIVVGPALGGITVAYELARALGRPGIFAERRDGEFALRRGFEVAAGTCVIVAEDVVTTGGSVREVLELLDRLGAKIIGVASLIRRGDRSSFDVPFTRLVDVEVEAWRPAECPICLESRLPVLKPGSRSGDTGGDPA